MASVSSPGLGSGLDIADIVTRLVAAERTPATNRLDVKEANYQAELSALGSIKSELSSFRSSINTYRDISNFESVSANTNDDSIFDVSTDKSADTGSYSVKVKQLAEAHSLSSVAVSGVDDVIGTGSLQFRFGTTSYTEGPFDYTGFVPNPDTSIKTVTIDDSNNTLQGIKDAVNAADIGVTAGIIYDGSDYRLTFTSDKTGTENSMEIIVDDTGDDNDTDTNGLSRLAFNEAAGAAVNMTQSLNPQDAILRINGIEVTSATNTVSDAISGVTLDLKKAQASDWTDAAINLQVERSDSVASNAVYNFVSEYNKVMETINSVSSYNQETNTSGILAGDSIIRSVTSQLRHIVSGRIAGVSGSYDTLASIGVVTERDGTLSVTNTTLKSALDAGVDVVGTLFAAAGQLTDSDTKYISSTSLSQAGEYAINITQAASQGTLTGTSAANLTITAGVNDTLSLSIDGINASITLSAKTYASAAELATELKSRINGAQALIDDGVTVDVTESSGVLSIKSVRYGSASTVSTTGGTAQTDLLGGVGTAVAGVDVEGSIGSAGATGSGRFLTGSGSASGIKIEILDAVIGDHGEINFTRGVADSMTTLINGVLDSKGGIAGKLDGIKGRIEDIGDDRVVLDRRMISLEDRLRAQFIVMDQLVGQLRATSNYLTQQLAALPEIGIINRR